MPIIVMLIKSKKRR